MSGSDATSTCPECGASVIKSEREHVCRSCGLVTARDPIDPGPEWRWGVNGETRRRTGAPLTRTRHDRGLSTEIGYVSGADVPSGNPRRIARLRREHNRAQISTKAQRNRVYGFTEIQRIAGVLELPDAVLERACVIFETAQAAELFQGRSLEGFAAAAIYVACRKMRIARTRGEIVEAARATLDELSAAYDALNRELELAIAPADPREFIPRFASRLELAAGAEHLARRYASELIDTGNAVGRNPGGVAGGCLYVAASAHGETISQQTVAEVADVSPVTIRAVANLIECT